MFRKNKILFVILVLVVVVGTLAVLYIIYFRASAIKSLGRSGTTTSTVLKFGAGTTTFDLVGKDYQDKKIDYETSLLYKVYYAFGDDRLPAQYSSATTGLFEATGVFREIKENYNKLSTSTKKLLEPFLKRPDDPASYIYQQYDDSSQTKAGEDGSWGMIDKALAANKRPTDLKNNFKSLVTFDQKIRVWYIEDKSGNGKKVAQQVIKDLDNNLAWYKFYKLLGQVAPPSDGSLGGDNKIDVYILKAGSFKKSKNSDINGMAVPDGSGNSSFILIRDDLVGNDLKTTSVHELFHVFQGAFFYNYIKNQWWEEGTAVWAEHYIYPTLNSEQDYLVDFIPEPETGLMETGSNHEYGAYLFVFYLAQKHGDDIVRKVYKLSEVSPYGLAIHSVNTTVNGGLQAGWPEFTLWNYNKPPANYYKDEGGFPDGNIYSSALAATTKWVDIEKIGTQNVKIATLEPLSARVMEFFNMVDGKKVKRIDFKNLNNFNRAGAKAIKAVIYTKNSSYIEDWTDISSRKFCLTDSKDNFTNIVLIFSNYYVEEDKSKTKLSIDIEAKDSCEEEKKQTAYTLTAYDKRTEINDPCTPDETGFPPPACSNDKYGIMQKTQTEHVFSATGKYIGPGIVPEYTTIYPYLGKWEMTYTMKRTYSIGQSYTLTGKATFDLSEAYDKIKNHGQSPAAFQIKDVTENKGGLTTWGLTGQYGLLIVDSLRQDSAKFELNLYDSIASRVLTKKIDLSNVVLYVKK